MIETRRAKDTVVCICSKIRQSRLTCIYRERLVDGLKLKDIRGWLLLCILQVAWSYFTMLLQRPRVLVRNIQEQLSGRMFQDNS